jgi:outer membrane protein assembly factor BamB
MVRLSSWPAALLLGLVLAAGCPAAGDAGWPQFRGPGGEGTAPDGVKFPTSFGPDRNVLWKTPLPAGLSSPCVWGERIFLTGFDAKTRKLETLCLDRKSGKVLWRREASAKAIERINGSNSPAAATVATDGERVFAYFGSCGLLCYDLAGNEQWKKDVPAASTRFGSATSPVVAGDVVLLKCQGGRSSLLALKARTGDVLWKKDWAGGDVGYSLPLVYRGKDATEVIVHGEMGIRAYDLKDGKERWTIGGMRCQAVPTPIAAEGLLYFVVQFAGGDLDDKLKIPSFDELLKKYDKNKDGKLSREEVKDVVLYSRDGVTKEGDIKLGSFFGMVDLNRDGYISRFEWGLVSTVSMVAPSNNSVLAVRPGGKGNVTYTHVAWRDRNSLPEVASPLVYRGRLYLIKDGGILSCLEAKKGKLLFRKRLGSVALYHASPVAADGKVYVASARGVVLVLRAADKLEVLARNDLKEAIRATPAAVGGVLYVRTEGHLYAFRE